MADSIANYVMNQHAWDPQDQQVTFDGIAVDNPGGDTKYTVTPTSNDQNTWSVQDDGTGIVNKSHNSQGDFNFNVSRMSNFWQYFLDHQDEILRGEHTIVGRSTADVSTTTTAVLGRIPDVSGGNNADSLQLSFHCKSINVKGNE